MKMKCPKCKTQTMKEDYSIMIKTGIDPEDNDTIYCPSCGYTVSRKILETQYNNIERELREIIGT